MIKECPLCLECKLMDIIELRTNVLILGGVVAGYSDEEYLTDGKPDIKKINPLVLTMPDNNYWTIGEHAGKAWDVGRNFIKSEK
jgi:flavin reductase (DIM6/NTAB) family NADH-FMN oxidoreductase RutF